MEQVHVGDSFIRNRKGLTLIEVLISILIGTLAILGVYRLYSSSLRTYNLQEQLSGMYQNGTYTIKKISEVLMQAGADLPQKNDTLLFVSSAHPDNFRIMINPKGAAYTFGSYVPATSSIPIPDASAFIGCDSILKDSLEALFQSYRISAVHTLYADTILITGTGTPVAFYSGTTIYGFKTVSYYWNSRNICYYDSLEKVLSENIDTLQIKYYDSAHVETQDWLKMKSAWIYVRSMTSLRDPRYKSPVYNDGYRRLPMSTEVRFRNKF
jgi:prepilin-type N-terminal cleavage/methylation domain-containing protein